MDAEHVRPVVGFVITLAWVVLVLVACWYRTPPRGW